MAGGKIKKRSRSPVAENINVEIEENTQIDISLVASDPNGDALTYSIIDPPTHGSVLLNGNVATYIPDLNYSGTDSFTYKANDGSLDSPLATVTVTVSIAGIPDNSGMLFGPFFPPPAGVTFSETGLPDDESIGRSSGKTYFFSDVNGAGTYPTYWGPVHGDIRLSFDGSGFTGAEILSFSADQLDQGIAVWTGQTLLMGNSSPVYTRAADFRGESGTSVENWRGGDGRSRPPFQREFEV